MDGLASKTGDIFVSAVFLKHSSLRESSTFGIGGPFGAFWVGVGLEFSPIWGLHDELPNTLLSCSTGCFQKVTLKTHLLQNLTGFIDQFWSHSWRANTNMKVHGFFGQQKVFRSMKGNPEKYTFSRCWFQALLFSPRTLGVSWSKLTYTYFSNGWFNQPPGSWLRWKRSNESNCQKAIKSSFP